MAYSKQHLKLINRIYCLFSDNLMCIKTWGVYIFDDDFKGETELQNKLSVIWLASLFDSIHAEVHHVEKYKKQAIELSLNHLPRYCDQALEFFESIKEIIQKYNKQEQVFIIHIRNQWVHSFLNGRHVDQTTIKYLQNGELITEHISQDDFNSLVQPMLNIGPLDNTLQEFVGRFSERDGRYWPIIDELHRTHEVMYEAMREGHQFQFSNISA